MGNRHSIVKILIFLFFHKSFRISIEAKCLLFKKLEVPYPLSTKIIRENQRIVLEDLNVSGMVKNRKLSRAISDVGCRTFRTFLERKAEKYGRDLRIISKWEPTSQ